MKLPFFTRTSRTDLKGRRKSRSGIKIGLSVVAVVSLTTLIGLFVLQPWNPEESSGQPPAPATSSTTVAAAAEPAQVSAAPSTTSARASATTTPVPASGSTWYDLTTLRSVVWNYGFSRADPVRIGTESFPAGIIGGSQSSTSNPSNKAIWALGGKCDRFEVWVGKNADSGNSGSGEGRFVVLADDREISSVTRGPADPPLLIDLDITGVVRLTVFDTRNSQDLSNAWGRPRVFCTSVPASTR